MLYDLRLDPIEAKLEPGPLIFKWEMVHPYPVFDDIATGTSFIDPKAKRPQYGCAPGIGGLDR
jgi:hypothetical protein